MGELITGDNLQVMRDMPEGSIDLIYADPPFNTGKDWGAFCDKWDGGLKGYMKFMEPRLQETRRLLNDSGSIYLHCDPHASHYLKVMMDGIFGMKNFRNEIVWKRNKCGGHSTHKKRMPNHHDTILFYAISENTQMHLLRKPLSSTTVDDMYSKRDRDGRAYSRNHLDRDKRRYLDESKGVLVGTIWDDHNLQLTPFDNERNGYATQKPVALLDRIIMASSNQGDIVLDPFCGSGTTLVSANELGRKWIGIDENPDAISISRERLKQLNLFTAV